MSTLKDFNLTIRQENTQKYLSDVLGKKKESFVTTLTAAVGDDKLLAEAEPMSIMYAAMKATTMDLPIDKNLGLAALIPFKDTKSNKTLCQLQIMRNGWVELAQRTGQICSLVNEVVHEGELVSKNKFTGDYVFDEDKRTSDKVIGYMAYVRLNNGFQKTVYWDVAKCLEHAKKYSKTFKFGSGLWATNFDAMALKTVLKHLINKYMPKSVTMLDAIRADQAVIDKELQPLEYIDNPVEEQEAQDVTSYNDLTPEEKKEIMRKNENKAPEMP